MLKHRLTTYDNARTSEGADGRTYVANEDVLELVRQIATKRGDLLSRLSDD